MTVSRRPAPATDPAAALADRVLGGLAQFLRQHQLSQSNLSDPVAGDEWRDALVVVQRNSVRHVVNRTYAEAFALRTQQPLFAWVPEWTAPGRTVADLPPALANALRTKIRRDHAELFVRGAPAVVDENICVALGIANGTPARLHALVFRDEARCAAVEQLRDSTPSGSVVWLPFPPDAVLVRVEGADDLHLPGLEPGVVPLTINPRSQGETVDVQRAFPPGQRPHNRSERMLQVKLQRFPVELGFAVTVYKVQGKTLSRIVLHLSPVPNGQKLSMQAALVMMTRTPATEGIRVLSAGRSDADIVPAALFDTARALDLPSWRARAPQMP